MEQPSRYRTKQPMLVVGGGRIGFNEGGRFFVFTLKYKKGGFPRHLYIYLFGFRFCTMKKAP